MAAFSLHPWQGPQYTTCTEKAADVLRQPHSFILGKSKPDEYDLRTRINREHTVCFTGHRMMNKQDATTATRMDQILEVLYQHGYRDFLCGGALGFDLFAAQHVILLRDKYPDVRLIFCLPCADQSSRWRGNDCAQYEQLLYHSDETRVLSKKYYNGCMHVRNAYMVDRSSICVCYMKKLGGGTLATVRYALSQDLPVVNIAVPSSLDELIQFF